MGERRFAERLVGQLSVGEKAEKRMDGKRRGQRAKRVKERRRRRYTGAVSNVDIAGRW